MPDICEYCGDYSIVLSYIADSGGSADTDVYSDVVRL